MKVLNYTLIMTPDETGGYVVTCPALPGLVTEGDTLEEARAMAADAILCYLEGLQKSGEPLPYDNTIAEAVTVKVAYNVVNVEAIPLKCRNNNFGL